MAQVTKVSERLDGFEEIGFERWWQISPIVNIKKNLINIFIIKIIILLAIQTHPKNKLQRKSYTFTEVIANVIAFF